MTVVMDMSQGMEHTMSLFWTPRSPVRSPLRRGRTTQRPGPSLTEPVDAEPSLPRHLLVVLAGIAADATSLRDRCSDAPQVQTALEMIVGRLDGLVDSIYRHATDLPAPDAHRDGHGA